MICEKCNNIIDEDSKFCSKCGERILVKVEESDINFIKKNEDNIKYQKIGGFLIFIGILLILGIFVSLGTIGEYFSVEYKEGMKNLFSQNYFLYKQIKVLYYLSIISFIWLILLNIFFFTKNTFTKNMAIGYFSYVICVNLYTVYFYLNNDLLNLANEIPKIVIQIIFLSIFIVYFLISKRVKATFIEKDINQNLESNFQNAKEEYLKEYNERKNNNDNL